MNDKMEDAIDALLREQFDGPVPADDFCDRVMERVPARRRRIGWPLAVGSLAGVGLCSLSLWSSPIARTGWQEWLSGLPSASALVLLIAMAGLSVLAMAWAIAEADGHPSPARGRGRP